MDNQNLEYNLPQDAYVNFDALSLKTFMINRLNEGGVFTDQNYEGSNISAILDILAFYTHVLMFYLNQTSSESMFSQATIYENMNRIVKTIGYKPTGAQTAMVPVECTALDTLPIGNYTIKRYSYFVLDSIQYTFLSDYTFDKITPVEEKITELNDVMIAHQGTVGEYPIYIASGLEFETIPIVVDNIVDSRDTRFIAHGTIAVYVKEKDSDRWFQYTEVDNLFLTGQVDRVVDIRLNENGHYELKFGNGIFGKKLKPGDEVSVFYILSDGDRGIISVGSIADNKLFTYNSRQFNEIYEDLNIPISNEINLQYSASLKFTNPRNSTLVADPETVDEIRNNIPNFVSSQLRLVNELDYENFLKKNISSAITDIKVVNNDKFMNGYIKYFYNICVDPNKVNRVILNQVNFSDSCDFNNINVFVVPSFRLIDDDTYPEFLSNSFKNLIISITKNKKMMTNEVVPRDPVYVAYDIGYDLTDTPTKSIRDDSKLVIVADRNNRVNRDILKRKVVECITTYFDPSNMKLGASINLSDITSDILSLAGVSGIKTVNTKSGAYHNGISFISWNPLFVGSDDRLVSQNTILEFFKFPYLNSKNSLINKIEIVDE